MKRIFTEQLKAELNRHFPQVYCLAGQDPLLLIESQDAICQAASQQGFHEKMTFQIDNSTDWNDIFELCQSMGLFSDKQILILNLPENLTALLQEKLVELISLLHADLLLIIKLVKLTKPMEKQAWYVQLSQTGGLLIACQTPNLVQLPNWINYRLKAMDMTAEPAAVQLLSYSYENNLLALNQVLQLLSLLYPDGKLTQIRVQQQIEQSAVFTPFHWIDALLEGKIKRARRILTELKNEDVQLPILLRTLQRELILLLQLAKSEQRVDLSMPLMPANLRERFDQLKVWQNRRALFTHALQRLTYQDLYHIFQQLAEVEKDTKQYFSEQVWQKLDALCVSICAPVPA